MFDADAAGLESPSPTERTGALAGCFFADFAAGFTADFLPESGAGCLAGSGDLGTLVLLIWPLKNQEGHYASSSTAS